MRPDGNLSLPSAPYRWPTRPRPGAAAARVGRFTGMFSNSGYGDFVVSLIGGSLYISYYGTSWPLSRFGGTTFLFKVQAFGTIFPVLVEYCKGRAAAP